MRTIKFVAPEEFWGEQLSSFSDDQSNSLPPSVRELSTTIRFPLKSVIFKTSNDVPSYFWEFKQYENPIRKIKGEDYWVIARSYRHVHSTFHVEDVCIRVSNKHVYLIRDAVDESNQDFNVDSECFLNSNYSSFLSYIPIVIRAIEHIDSLVKTYEERRQQLIGDKSLNATERKPKSKLLAEESKTTLQHLFFQIRDLLYPIDSRPFDNLLTLDNRWSFWIELMDIPAIDPNQLEIEYRKSNKGNH